MLVYLAVALAYLMFGGSTIAHYHMVPGVQGKDLQRRGLVTSLRWQAGKNAKVPLKFYG